MGPKLVLATAVVAVSGAGIAGYIAMKQPHRYDPRIESIISDEAKVEYRVAATTGARIEYQITHLLVVVSGTNSGEQGAEQLVARLRGRGWSIDKAGIGGYLGMPVGVATKAAVSIENYADVAREPHFDLTGTYEDLRRHAGSRQDLVLVIIEAQE